MPIRVIKIDPKQPEVGALKEALAILLAGGVVVYPTDTAYGLGVDALNDSAIGKIFILKRRMQKPLPVIVTGVEMAKRVAVVNAGALAFAKRYWPGALTLILPKQETVPASLTLGLPTIGVRQSASAVAQVLVERLGRPITSTSANISGKGVAYSVDEVLRHFREAELQPDLVLDAGLLPEIPPSTVLDLTKSPPEVVREGPVKVHLGKTAAS